MTHPSGIATTRSFVVGSDRCVDAGGKFLVGGEQMWAACDGEWDRRVEQVCAGMSLGVVAAQHMLQTKPGARGGLLLHSFIEPPQLGGSWPDQCPVDVLAMQGDPFFVEDGDLAAARQWQTTHPNLHIHLYPGVGHLFTEPASPDQDAATTRLLVHDILATINHDRSRP